MPINRRAFVVSAGAAVLLPRVARAATVTDATGRELPIPGKVRACFPRARRLQFCSTRSRRICCSAGHVPIARRNAPTCCRMFALGLNSAASPGGVTLPISKA